MSSDLKQQKQGQVVGLVVTGAIHLLVVVMILVTGRGREPKKKNRESEEQVISTRIIQIQAGSPDGRRTSGKAYRRSKRPRRRSKTRTSPWHRRLRDQGPVVHKRTRRTSTPVEDDGKDDALDVPSEFHSTMGADAPRGAMSSDDRKGAHGDADMGALDPCYSQHGAVVAGYFRKAKSKIPRFKRPAFVTADVEANLKVLVRVVFNVSGKIVRVSVAKASGNPRYDQAVVAHVKRIGSFPPPHRCVMYSKGKMKFMATRSFLYTPK